MSEFVLVCLVLILCLIAIVCIIGQIAAIIYAWGNELFRDDSPKITKIIRGIFIPIPTYILVIVLFCIYFLI